MSNLKAGFVGLGDMGGPIAQRIIDGGFPTTLWARRESSLEPYKNSEAAVAATPKDLGAACDVVGVCVFDDAGVKRVVLGGGDGILYGMKPGSVLAIHSTISMETCVELEKLGKERGITVLDAPVSGAKAKQSAIEGTLVVMAGGDEKGFEIAKPVFETFGSTVCHLGAIGSGQRAKVLNNVLGFCNLRMGYLALEIAKKLDLDDKAVSQVLCNGSGSSATMNILVNALIPNPDFARHAVSMTEKDTYLFQDLCREMGVDRSLMDQVAEEAIQVVDQLGKDKN